MHIYNLYTYGIHIVPPPMTTPVTVAIQKSPKAHKTNDIILIHDW